MPLRPALPECNVASSLGLRAPRPRRRASAAVGAGGVFCLPSDGATLPVEGISLTVNVASPVKQQALQFLDFIGRSWQSVAFANDENSISSLDVVKGVAPEKL